MFTGVRGYLDDVDLSKVKEFETGIIEKIKSEKSEIISAIESSGNLEKDTEEALAKIIQDFKNSKK